MGLLKDRGVCSVLSQAIYEDLTIITKDSMIPKYDVSVLW